MMTWLDTVGPALWRASWQAAVVALLVVLVLRSLGERIAPRWRYLLWSIVVIRLLCVATPSSPWSAFNLVGGKPEPSVRRMIPPPATPVRTAEEDVQPTAVPIGTGIRSPQGVESVAKSPAPDLSKPGVSLPVPAETTPGSMPTASRLPLVRILTTACLAGCLVFGLQLCGAALVLHRRLSACRPVTDAAVLSMLETACQKVGLRRRPALLVTPEPISPCSVGTWKPRIIVPEAIVGESSTLWLRHVLAHEVAHLVRGDLWTNWLLLMARVLHWFNPVSWWTIRAMQAEREAACDELALAALDEADRSSYAATIIDMAASLTPSGMAPGMIGLISSTRRLQARIQRLARPPAVAPLRAPWAAGLVLGIALVGLTDAMPIATATQAPAQSAPVAEKGQEAEAETVTLRGRCVDQVDSSALAGARVRLFKVAGLVGIAEIASTVSDREGRFEFPRLTPQRPDDPVDPLIYLVFAEADDRPIAMGRIGLTPARIKVPLVIQIPREQTTLSGTVLDARGRPVAGAMVASWAVYRMPVPGILSAMTGADGRFEIHRIPHATRTRKEARELSPREAMELSPSRFTVSHPDYPQAQLEVRELPANVTVTLAVGCQVTGTVMDSVTGRPAADAAVIAERLGDPGLQTPVATDAAGRFKIALHEDRYNFIVRAKDRVGIAITDRECLDGQKVELPPFSLIRGGVITGQAINAATGQPISVNDQGVPIRIGLRGPSQPAARGVYSFGAKMAAVDREGRYTLRAAPGENFPFLMNVQGDRVAQNLPQQPAVVVKEGETVVCNLLVTAKTTPAEKLKAARKLVASLPTKPSERTAQILAELRKLRYTIHEEELWCALMFELAAIGRDAVPQLSAELDRTTENWTLRRLGFALRAIGDPRAVPALIRAIPKTLGGGGSDYGLSVADDALAAFMQKHDLRNEPPKGQQFHFGRPVREVISALQKLSGQDFDDSELLHVNTGDDPRRQVLARRLFNRQARRWQTWWEMHWREFTNDAAYQKVGLNVEDEPVPPASTTLGPKARVDHRGGVNGEILSPAIQEGKYAEHFCDLDTGAMPKWPAHIPRDEARIDPKQLADWAAATGADLMCVTHRAPDGTQTFALKSLGLKAWEIGEQDLRNLDNLIAAGTLPKGHEVGELLMHYDEKTKKTIPDANGAFLYVTREGNMGLIEVTDRITRTVNLAGTIGPPPAGVGVFKGVSFNLKSIIP
jgi:beta-lactamase regulating signal transducer with metallopeptidase domain